MGRPGSSSRGDAEPGLASAAMSVSEEPVTVFLVYGHNHPVRNQVGLLLRAAGMRVLSWNDGMLEQIGDGPRTNWKNVEQCIKDASKIVVLYTPDEWTVNTFAEEKPPEPRPRPNVILELGFAYALRSKDTVVVTFGCEVPSDLAGVHHVQWLGPSSRWDLLREITREKPVHDELLLSHDMSACDELIAGGTPIARAAPASAMSAIEALPDAAADAPEPTIRCAWSPPIDAIVVGGRLRLIVPDGRGIMAVDPITGDVLQRVDLSAPVEEVELTNDGLFVCARAGDTVTVSGLSRTGDLLRPWAPVALPPKRRWQLLTAEGRGTSVRIFVADAGESVVYEATDRSTKAVPFPPEPVSGAAAGAVGFVTIPITTRTTAGVGNAPMWELVDAAAKARSTLTVWAGGPSALVERKDPSGVERRTFKMPGPASQVAVARQRSNEPPDLVLAHIGNELLGWSWDDLPRQSQ